MTILVTPWLSLDPINVPKFLILVLCSFTIIGYLAPYLKQIFNSEARILAYSVLLFWLSLVIVFFMSESDSWLQIYGTYGRNTGLLAYTGLALILLTVVFISNLGFLNKLIWVLIITGMANAVYGLIQWSGNDPVDWSNPYQPILGTLGNPNFVSAHLGIAGLASLTLALDSHRGLASRLSTLVNVGLSLFVIIKSNSSQGLLVFTLGSTIVLYFRFIRPLHLIVRLSYWLSVFGGILIGIVGVLNKGPLAPILYQESVAYRGDYWKAGWRMTLDNPVFGVGIDSYGDWYRVSRTEEAALRRGPDVVSNSAHNVFLDISSNGGLLLLSSYLFIFGCVLNSAIRILKKSNEFDAVGVGLTSAWAAYVIQSVISINQLGLAIWGWALGGAIVGYDLYQERPSAVKVKRQGINLSERLSPSQLLSGVVGFVMGLAISIWPMTKDISFKDALESGDALKIERAVNSFPSSNYYYIYAGQIFKENKLEERVLEMAKKTIEINPREYNAWKLLSESPKISQVERDVAIANMKELDPFNNELGK